MGEKVMRHHPRVAARALLPLTDPFNGMQWRPGNERDGAYALLGAGRRSGGRLEKWLPCAAGHSSAELIGLETDLPWGR
jgi:hypothetical protein